MTGLLTITSSTFSELSMYFRKFYRSSTFFIKYPSSINLHDNAMFSAVYSLSPVNIMNFIPPERNEKMVYATKSWSLSYIPVAPIKVNPFSISYTFSEKISTFEG